MLNLHLLFKNVSIMTEDALLNPAQEAEETLKVDYSTFTLAQLVEALQEILKDEAKMELHRQVEAIRASFYQLLNKQKAAIESTEEGFVETVENGLDQLENVFKELYAEYKKERAAYNKEQDALKAVNLEKKRAIIEAIKELVAKGEDSSTTYPAFQALQASWRETGPVPQANFKEINETYQLAVEHFYDFLQINRELRDLDFKKNYEAKIAFCEKAEELAASENPVASFRALQTLHDEWKAVGPVAKQYRDEIWERFRAATAVVNKRYQAFVLESKAAFEQNLAAKTALCEKVEEIAAKEGLSIAEFNTFSKAIEDIQAEWRKIGYAAKKDNQKIYERFRAACDAFYEKKRVALTSHKDSIAENIKLKIQLCEQAEALKLSTEWKKTTDALIALQKQWKEIGVVPRKKSEELWLRFRAACDEFFAERDKNAKPENDFYANLKAKKAIIAEIKAYEPTGDDAADLAAYNAFVERYNAIGFVPFKEKDKLAAAYKEAVAGKFADFTQKRSRSAAKPISERERLMKLYYQKEQEIANSENNIGFFGKGAEALVDSLLQSIEKGKAELKELEKKIRELD